MSVVLPAPFSPTMATVDPAGRKPDLVVRVPERDQVFVDLRRHRENLRRRYKDEYERFEREEREYIAVIWLKGVHQHGKPGDDNRVRWVTTSGKAVVINPTDREQDDEVLRRRATAQDQKRYQRP